MSDLIIFLAILGFTFFSGIIIEKNHLRKLRQREVSFIGKPLVYDNKNFELRGKIRSVELVSGEVVIAVEYYRYFIAALKGVFGGRLQMFESILERGRREALLRMREKAADADCIINPRIETIMIDSKTPQCAVIAYGTAITYY